MRQLGVINIFALMKSAANFNFQKFEFTYHSLIRAAERGITIDRIKETIEFGEMIGDYPDDKPFRSFLYLKFIEGRPLHVCFATVNETTCRVITVYEPDLSIFEADFKTKRKT